MDKHLEKNQILKSRPRPKKIESKKRYMYRQTYKIDTLVLKLKLVKT